MTTTLVVGLSADPPARFTAQAADLARRLDADLEVVRVLELTTLAALPAAPLGAAPVLLEEPLRAEALPPLDEERQLLHDRLTADPALSGVRWSVHVCQGSPATSLLQRADEVDAFAVVVGAAAHGVSAVLDHVLAGSTCRDVVKHARRPVVVLPR